MMFARLSVLILSFNFVIALIANANIPLGACSTVAECKNASWQGSSENALQSDIEQTIDTGEYKTTRIEAGLIQPLDIFNSIAQGFDLLTGLVLGTLDGAYSITSFFLCGGNVCVFDDSDWGIQAQGIANLARLFSYIVFILGFAQFMRGLNIESRN